MFAFTGHGSGFDSAWTVGNERWAMVRRRACSRDRSLHGGAVAKCGLNVRIARTVPLKLTRIGST